MIAEQFRHAPAPVPRSLVDEFLDQARRRPGRLAVDDSRVRWSYQELLENSARVAAFLLHHRPVGNRRVLLFAGKSTYSAAAILGTWMAGWAYGCIDEGYPLALAQGACNIIKPDLVLVTNEHGEFDPALIAATGGDLPIIHVAELVADTAGSEGDVIDSGFAARGRGEDIAYFGFTSGTTGRPKTIAMSHRGFLHSMDRHIADFGFNERDRIAVQSCFSFDPAVMDLLSAINVGGVAVMVPTDLYCSGPAWSAHLQRHGVTSVMCVPGAMEIALEGLQLSQRFPVLRRIIFTGDKVRPHLVRLFKKWLDVSISLHNAFGLSEAPYLLHGRINHKDSFSGLKFDLPNSTHGISLERSVIEKHMELVATGPILFSGYLHDKRTCLDRFPISNVHKTGDLFRPDGDQLRYVRRFDKRLNWWGHRIEPAEIEQAFLSDHRVRDVKLTSESSDDLLCEVVPVQNAALTLEDARSVAHHLLPVAVASALKIRIAETFTPKRMSDHAPPQF